MTPLPNPPAWSEPIPILELCRNRQQAIDQVLERLIDPGHGLSTIAVLGDAGLGKSRAIQALGAGASSRGMAAIELKTGDGHQDPFSSVCSGFPRLAPMLVDGLEGPSWQQAVDQIHQAKTDVGLLILIDDAHAMDPDSARFLTFLHRASLRSRDAGPFVAVAMAVPEVDLLPNDLARRLIKAQQTSYLELEPLHQAELAELVGVIFADASAPIRRALTVDLMHRSEGHPSVIDALIPLVNRSTYSIDLGPAPHPGSVDSVIADANRSVVDGAFREAVQKLTSLDGVPGINLNTATRTLLALSLYRVGAYPEAERITRNLVDEALAADDHPSAFAAASLGLPEAEQHEGSVVRVEGLLRIDPQRLDADDRFRHAAVTARQSILIGESSQAERFFESAAELAKTADQRASAANTGWYLNHHRTDPNELCAKLFELAAEPGLSPSWQLVLNEHLCISLYESGNIAKATAMLEEVGRQAAEVNDALRIWHYLCFQNLLAFEGGQWALAEQRRIEAMAHAQNNVIAEGEHLYLAQKFNEAWVKNEQAVFAPMLSKLPPEIGGSWFGRVARVEALRAAGMAEQAVDDGRELIRLCLEEPGHRVLPALAYMSQFIRGVCSESERREIVSLLEPRAGSMLLHGLGSASFGPVDRYMFHISGDLDHLRRAIEIADEAGLRLWQVLLRAEYTTASDQDEQLLTRQAASIAEGTDLTALLQLW